MIIAVDFDGTIVENDYPRIGAPKYNVIVALQNMQAAGHELILWTCRHGKELTDAITYCEKVHGLHFSKVNESSNVSLGCYESSGRKIGADLYVDDRAISPEQFVTFTELALEMLNNVW